MVKDCFKHITCIMLKFHDNHIYVNKNYSKLIDLLKVTLSSNKAQFKPREIKRKYFFRALHGPWQGWLPVLQCAHLP